MKLELKHLASYLPYKLKVYHKTFNEHSKITISIIEELTTISYECASFANSMDYYFEDIEDNECDIKPILFPLSSLTIDEMKNITGSSFYRYSEDFLETILNTMKLEINSKKLPYYLMEKLFERKFDVFGLIDAGLAEPVTEEFNPYK